MPSDLNVLVLCPDLMFASQIHGAIQRAGLVGRTCLSQKTAEAQLERLPPGSWVVVDLEIPGLNVPQLRTAAKHARIIAFGPHVHEQLLTNAQEAGYDIVLTRGQAASQLGDILEKVRSSD